MRHFLYLLNILLFLSLTSCVQDLNFEEPQPSGDKNESKFKNKFQGVYLCLEDSSILTIERVNIVQQWHITANITKTQIDTTDEIELKNGLLYTVNDAEPFHVIFSGDTAELSYDYDKTIFELGDNQLLRYFKGMYFLNFKESENLWSVKTLTFDKEGILSINRIYGGEQEIQRIKEMTTVEEITDKQGKVVDYKVKPTKKELKEILNSDLFKEGKNFQKIKK